MYRGRFARTQILRLVAVTRVETTIRPVPVLSHDPRDPPYSQKKLNRANISSEKQVEESFERVESGATSFNFLLFFFRLFAQYRMTNFSRIGKQELWTEIKKKILEREKDYGKERLVAHPNKKASNYDRFR